MTETALPGACSQVRPMTGDFSAFFAGTYPALAGFAATLVRDVDLGHEIAQDAMVQLYARWFAVREPRPYAYRVVIRLAAKELGRRDQLDEHTDLVPARGDDPYLRADIVDAFMRLPSRLRTVGVLFFLVDLSIADIAIAVARPQGTVKRRLMEVRRHLQTQLVEGDRL